MADQGPGLWNTGEEVSPNRSLTRFLETDLEKKDRTVKIFQFFFPWVLWLLLGTTMVLILAGWKGWDNARNLLDVFLFYTLPPAGKETLIPLAVLDKEAPVPGFMAGMTTTMVDVCFSLFLIWNYDWVKKLPVLGPALERTEAKGKERVAKTRWFGKATFIMTTMFVFVPFSGSGGTGGTIFGRVVGMRPYKVLAAVAIGSAIGSTGFAVAAESLSNLLSEDSPFLSFMSNLNILQLVLVLILVGFIVYTVRNPKMAAIRTTTAVSQALDLSEKAIVKGEEQRKKLTSATISGTKVTMKALGEVNRTLVDIPVEVVVLPLEFMGSDGKKAAADTRKMTRKLVDDTHQAFGSAIDETMDIGDQFSNITMESMEFITMEGISQTRKGWNRTGRVIIRGGEHLENMMERTRSRKKDCSPRKESDQ